jgi:hypothetical protein
MQAIQYQEITVPCKLRIPVGAWFVRFMPIWDTNEETGAEWVCDVEAEVVRVTAEDHWANGLERAEFDPCITEWDDTHDLTDRLYATEDEARTHAEWTVRRFKNPAPWTNRVKL